jgi:hypothetical protein
MTDLQTALKAAQPVGKPDAISEQAVHRRSQVQRYRDEVRYLRSELKRLKGERSQIMKILVNGVEQ